MLLIQVVYTLSECIKRQILMHMVIANLNFKKVRFLYSAVYAMTGSERFTISKVAVDWQEAIVHAA